MRVAVVGAGFSGVAVAWQLLGSLPAGSAITLINGSGRFARGLAYGTKSADHLLNVPAARMSLAPAQPDHFLDWLRRDEPALGGHEFVSRQRYGDYLQSSLEVRALDHSAVSLEQRVAVVKDCVPQAQGWRLDFADGSRTLVDTVILAIGHLPPRDPHPQLAGLRAYVGDPWAGGVPADLAPDAPVALIGSGLTMLDMLITLRARGHHGAVLALSRRGLLPQSHRPNEAPPRPWSLQLSTPAGQPLHRLMRQFRAELVRAQASGLDWRDVWAAFRPQTPAAWQALDSRQRRQFLRHVLPYWDIHRHRAAPQAHAVLTSDLASGRLRQAAGRVVAVREEGSRLRLSWRARGSRTTQDFDATCIVNCSGPSSAIDARSSPLLWRLQQTGLLKACPEGLGLQVDERYRLINAAGEPCAGLYYIGPHLRAQRWEATAVPELRDHAAELASGLLRR